MNYLGFSAFCQEKNENESKCEIEDEKTLSMLYVTLISLLINFSEWIILVFLFSREKMKHTTIMKLIIYNSKYRDTKHRKQKNCLSLLKTIIEQSDLSNIHLRRRSRRKFTFSSVSLDPFELWKTKAFVGKWNINQCLVEILTVDFFLNYR